MKKLAPVVVVVVLLALIIAGLNWLPRSPSTSAGTVSDKGNKAIIINEALRTLLYIPLYHAEAGGFFESEGLDVEIVTGGTATNASAAMLSGEAHFSVADPMYVPIQRENGAEVKVVAQVVARIAVWGVASENGPQDMQAVSLRGRRIATHPRPMTAYTYTVKTIRDQGLVPDEDVVIVQSKPGTEIAPLISGQVDFAMTLEPNVSRAEAEGAQVVLSYPVILGDQIFTGLMTRESIIHEDRDMVVRVVRAHQRALDDIREDPDRALQSARKYFPQLPDNVLRAAINRMIAEGVVPTTVEVSEDSWTRAMSVRLDAGDLKLPSTREDACDIDIMREARQ